MKAIYLKDRNTMIIYACGNYDHDSVIEEARGLMNATGIAMVVFSNCDEIEIV